MLYLASEERLAKSFCHGLVKLNGYLVLIFEMGLSNEIQAFSTFPALLYNIKSKYCLFYRLL